jgi:hypothetical protein
VKYISRSQLNGSFGAHSGPSQGDLSRRAFRPTEASKAAARYVRFTSGRAVRCAQLADCVANATDIP